MRTVLAIFSLLAIARSLHDGCKCVPGDPCWPADDEWEKLNQTVGGNLIRGVPPGSVCYEDQSNFNESKCEHVLASWFNSMFHAEDPISVGYPQWADNPCPPIFPNGTSITGDPGAGKRGCSLGGYPVYALNATQTQHIQAVAKFAKDKRIRLNVKSTGHSFTGRSTGYGSLSVWTHYLQGMEFQENFQPESCTGNNSQMALRIAAGHRVRDVYEAANEHDAIVVGGSAQDVGIVGWASSGGHGPLSSTYGMGADNMLQATIVTPDGEVVTANECVHPDLFWAMRGGGGSTFGVITEVVMKAYPDPTTESVSWQLAPLDLEAPNQTAFWEAMAYLLSEFPRLKNEGLSGYHFLSGPPLAPYITAVGSFSLFGQPNGTAEQLMKSVADNITRVSDVNFTTTSSWSPTFFESWNASIGYEAVGTGSAVLGSRLIPAHPMETDSKRVSQIFRNLTEVALGVQFYAVANSANRDLNVSLNPAWRDAVIHTITIDSWPDGGGSEARQEGYDDMTYNLVPQLKSLAPDSGSYHNEGDPHDPNWQYTFFGENYERLRSVKQQYDPDSVFWCLSCVGSEDWEPDNTGRLCKVPRAA